MRIIFDASNHTMYPIGGEGLTSGTVQMVREISDGLAERGHTVHVITPDLATEDQRGETLWYWPPTNHPTDVDVAVQLMHVNPQPNYDADILLLMTYGCDPFLGPNHEWAQQVDGFPVFCQTHADIMRKLRPTIPEEKCFFTGLGVTLDDYLDPGFLTPLPIAMAPTKQERLARFKAPSRMLYANDPARGLWNVLDIFDYVKKEVPEATLHVAYDFDRGLQAHAWEHSQLAQMLWECKRRIETTEGVVNLGALTREQIIREELETQVHCMPSDPPNTGTQIWGMLQMECAAAGAALVLSDVEAFPEVFVEGATILPVIGKYLPNIERRCDPADYAGVVIELMKDPAKWQEASRKARALAEQHTWGKVIDRWEAMLSKLKGEEID